MWNIYDGDGFFELQQNSYGIELKLKLGCRLVNGQKDGHLTIKDSIVPNCSLIRSIPI